MIGQINNDTRTSGTDASNLGDYRTITVNIIGGKEIQLILYGS